MIANTTKPNQDPARSEEDSKTQSVASVLLVDDDSEVRDILKEIFASAPLSIRVIEASDGSEALRKLSNQQFAVLVTDLRMPKVSGADILKQLTTLRSRSRPDSILVLSAYPEECEFYPIANVTFIQKPADSTALIGFLTEALKKKKPEEAVSRVGMQYLPTILESCLNVLEITFNITAVLRMISPVEINPEEAYHVIMRIEGEKIFGYIMIAVEPRLQKELMKLAESECTAEELPRAEDASKELLNQVFGKLKAKLFTAGYKIKGIFPVMIKGKFNLPAEFQIRKPAVAYCVSPQGVLRVESMMVVK